MDPVSVSAVLALVDWKKLAQGLATDAAKKGAKGLLGRLKPDEREKAAKHALGLFVQEFLGELEDKTPFARALPGYHDQLKRLIEHALQTLLAGCSRRPRISIFGRSGECG